MLRELKDRSGLTLRGLEERAAAQGEVLARSTVADMLRKDSLPRPELPAVYVRACGVEQPAAWLRARERLATGIHDAVEVPEQRKTVSDRPLWQRPSVVLAAVVVAVLGMTTVFLQGDVLPSAQLLPLVSAGSWATIHAADAPDLCLTEGRDSSGRYPSEIAALRPCAVPGPRVFLQPVGDEFTTIKWEHPVEKVIGCLTVIRSGPAEHLVEPQNHCADDNDDQLFRVELVRDQRYRFRSAGGSACVGLRGGAVVEGAEAVREPCADEADQEFTVDLTSSGRVQPIVDG